MHIQEEKIDALNAHLKLEVKQEDYLPKVDEAIKKYRKQVSLKGFRPGHVPMGMVKKMVGQQVMAESINEVLNESINKYLQDNEIEILGYPIPKDDQELNFDIDKAGDFNFVYELGLTPEFELKALNKKTKFNKPVVDVTDEMVTEEIEVIQKRYGQPGQVDDVEEDDILKIHFQQLDDKGEILEGGIDNETTINLRMVKDKMQKKVMGMKKGDSIDADITKLIEREADAIAKHVLDVEHDLMEAGNLKYRCTLTEITRIQPAELNETLFQNALGDDSIKDEEAFRARIREEIEQHYGRTSDQKLVTEIADKLLDKTEIPLPEDFLRRWIKLSNEQEITDAQLDDEFQNFTKNLRWSLIVNKLGKENDLKAEQDEIVERARGQVLNQMYQYGLYNPEPEQIEQLVARYLQDRDFVSRTRDSILEEKAFEIIKDQVTIQDKKVSLEEFNKAS